MSRRRHSYPLCHRSEPALLRHALGEVDSHLGVDHTPVLPTSGPLFRDIHHGQIQHFQQAVIGGEHGFGFGHLAQLAVEALDGIGGVNQPPDVTISYNYIGILPANLLYDVMNGKAA